MARIRSGCGSCPIVDTFPCRWRRSGPSQLIGERLASRLPAPQIVEHAVERRGHRLDLVVGQLLEEVATNGLGMPRCRLLDGPPAGLGQPHHQTPSILRTFLSDDEAPLFHTAEVMGKAAAVPTDLAAQVASSKDPAWRL